MGWETQCANLREFKWIENFDEARQMLIEVRMNAGNRQWLIEREPRLYLLHEYGVIFPRTFTETAQALLALNKQHYIARLTDERRSMWYAVYQAAIREAHRLKLGTLELELYGALIRIYFRHGLFDQVDQEMHIVETLIEAQVNGTKPRDDPDYTFSDFAAIFHGLYKQCEADKTQQMRLKWFRGVDILLGYTGYERLIGRLHWLMANVYSDLGHRVEAQTHARKARQASKIADDADSVVYNTLQAVYDYLITGEMERAARSLNQVRAYARTPATQAAYAIERAEYEYKNQSFRNSVRWSMTAVRILDVHAAHMPHDAYHQLKGRALQKVGMALLKRQQYAESVTFLLEAERILSELNDPYPIANSIYMRGFVLMKEGRDLKGALAVLNHAYAVAGSIQAVGDRQKLRANIRETINECHSLHS